MSDSQKLQIATRARGASIYNRNADSTSDLNQQSGLRKKVAAKIAKADPEEQVPVHLR